MREDTLTYFKEKGSKFTCKHSSVLSAPALPLVATTTYVGYKPDISTHDTAGDEALCRIPCQDILAVELVDPEAFDLPVGRCTCHA